MTPDYNPLLLREVGLLDFEEKAGRERIENEKSVYGRELLGTYGEELKQMIATPPPTLPLPLSVRWRRFKHKISNIFRRKQ